MTGFCKAYSKWSLDPLQRPLLETDVGSKLCKSI